MSNMIDYIKWRGDLTFSQDPINAVDHLIFASLSYIRLDGLYAEDALMPIPITELAERLFRLPDAQTRGRHQNDLKLLKTAAASQRFGKVGVSRCRNQFVAEEDTQFAAETFVLDNGSIVIAFRGTDNTLVGWKEDFNMCFQQSVPSQRLAVDYVRELYAEYLAPMTLCGHSKGGNLAVFSAARCSPMIRSNIQGVYNFDGPGFTDYMMGDPGYLAMVPKIHTYVPQSSVIGMLMDREEPYSIVHSNQISIQQHDAYSWEVLGKELVPEAQLTSDSVFVNAMLKTWLKEMPMEERNEMVEALFAMLSTGDVERAVDVFNPKNLRSYLRFFGSNDNVRRVLTGELENLLNAAVKTGKGETTLRRDATQDLLL